MFDHFDQLTDNNDNEPYMVGMGQDHYYPKSKLKYAKFQKFGKFKYSNNNLMNCDAESDPGEDFGEDGPLSNKPYAKKNIGKLHKYRERIQVLNEDLNVLIFDGEEEIEQNEK